MTMKGLFRVPGLLGLPGFRNAAPPSTGVRYISGKALRLDEDQKNKRHHYPYETHDFGALAQFFDKTTLKMDENSKLIVVEGAHGVGKTKFARELADDLGMKFIGYPNVEELCKNHYGVDLRNYNEAFFPRNRIFTDIDFIRDPMGGVEGSCDRFHFLMYIRKLENHVMALAHIFSTGQGVVMEGCPASDYAYFDAAYNQGWINDPMTRTIHRETSRYSLHQLLRPNLIIYLDAPVDVVQKRIAEKNNEWDKDSPVWKNKRYLSDIYNELKNNYLKNQLSHSYVLAYDWSEPGDAEVVVEDIESLNFDDLPVWETQQRDWRWFDEVGAATLRKQYCSGTGRNRIMHSCVAHQLIDNKHLFCYGEDALNMQDVMDWVKSERYAPGFNVSMGDNFWSIFFSKLSDYEQSMKYNKLYYPFRSPRSVGPEGF